MGVDNKEAPPKGLTTVPPCVSPVTVTGVKPGAGEGYIENEVSALELKTKERNANSHTAAATGGGC